MPGWELYTTTSGTSYAGLGDMQGVPLGTYDFGVGPDDVNLSNTDTIIQRMATATPDNNVIPIQMVALQLQTTQMVNYNNDGLAFYYITLQPANASTGTDTITFATNTSGTYTSSINIFYDIHMGSLTGPIVESSNVTVTTSGTVPGWSNNAPFFSVLIPGVDQNLNGANNLNDFWQQPNLTDAFAGPAFQIPVADAMLPEPSSWVLALIGAAALAAVARGRRATVGR